MPMMGPYWNGGGWWWMAGTMALFRALLIVGIFALIRFMTASNVAPRVGGSEALPVTEHDARGRSGAPEHGAHVVGSRGMI